MEEESCSAGEGLLEDGALAVGSAEDLSTASEECDGSQRFAYRFVKRIPVGFASGACCAVFQGVSLLPIHQNILYALCLLAIDFFLVMTMIGNPIASVTA